MEIAVIVPELRVVAHTWAALPNVWWVFVASDGAWHFFDRVGGADQATALEHLNETASTFASTAELNLHQGMPPEAMTRLVPGRRCSDEPRAMILGMVN
jgi:hypothetical protein